MNHDNARFAAVVVLYNPDEKVAENIESYSPLVEKVYLVSNSENVSQKEIELSNYNSKYVYIPNYSNMGIAYALNQGVNQAIKDGVSWVLTMDQDSNFGAGELKSLMDFVVTDPNAHTIGIASPYHATPGNSYPDHTNPEEITEVMTSGNLLSTRAFSTVGPFDESYFIDMVDHEYCLRLWSKKFRVIRVNKSILTHELGKVRPYKFFWMNNVLSSNHSPIRRYYMMRNYLFMRGHYYKEFKKHFKWHARHFVKHMVKAVLLESKRPTLLYYLLRAVFHYMIGVRGKLEIKGK